MTDQEEIREILLEIRDNQLRAIENQEKHISLTQEQVERAKKQIEESIGLQRQAIEKTKTVMRIALPGIALCIALIIYLVVKYF
ncbi:MAG: hypothetical protein R3318_06870 [Gammaproteobacteria bacterium]|nr:hypothetical protein [Gammaproteobacteria bacterium]